MVRNVIGRSAAVAASLAAIGLLPGAVGAAGKQGGHLIAFHADPKGNDDLFVLDSSSKRVRRLTRGLEEIATPVWSPDGNRVAFLARPDGVADIYLVNADGTALRSLTHSEGDHYALAWSPNGRKLAYVCCGEGKQAIYVINADGSQRIRLATQAGQARWSPDGSRLAFLSFATGNPELYTMGADGSDRRRLTDNKAEDADPSWSPDGKSIAFDSKRASGRSQIYVMSADGSGQRRLVADRWTDQEPSWAPNGKSILFTSYRNRDPNTLGIGNAEIVVVDPARPKPRNVTHTRFWEGDPTWSPDGRSIAYAIRRDFGPNGLFRIEVMRADGTGRKTFPALRSLGNSCCPAWQP